MRPLAAVLGLALSLAASEARASCISSASLCPCVGASVVLDATITKVEGPKTTVRIAAVHGEASEHEADEELVLVREPEDVVGARTLVPWNEGGYQRRFAVDDAGRITCTEAEPAFRIEADRVVPMMLSDECHAKVVEAGFQEPPCNDTGGCATGPTGVMALSALLLLHRRRTRRAT